MLQPNRYMRNILTTLLRSAGAGDVLQVPHADLALSLLGERAPSLIVMDWDAHDDPEEDRLRLIRRIREHANPATRETPVIVVTSPCPRRSIEMARDAGVTEVLVTPLAPITMQERLRSLESQPRGFVASPRFSGPDRRRRPRRAEGPSLKRTADVEAGLTTAMQAARAAAVALAHETRLSGDPLAIRVGRSLQRFMAHLTEYTPIEAEVVDMHRAALAQLVRMAEDGHKLREPVVTGLEQVVAKRMRRR
ncbi:response regulator [Maricaulis sp. CAU 1757]